MSKAVLCTKSRDLFALQTIAVELTFDGCHFGRGKSSEALHSREFFHVAFEQCTTSRLPTDAASFAANGANS